ncbi:MAG TPA: hypothetical protein VK638_48590 [Edaphobacter sp.]|nr:hypothetical protein [Edaphobacter sp.]
MLIDPQPHFQSFLQAGFECSTHRNGNRQRLDLVESSKHDLFVTEDFLRLQDLDIRTVREGARWHIIEESPGIYEFSSLERIYDAAQKVGMEIILDLLHFGYPEFVNVYEPDFVAAFEGFTQATVEFLHRRGLERHFIVPVNEISYFAWAGGDQGLINPHSTQRGPELKKQLIRAAIAASQVLLDGLPNVVLGTAEPVIHITGRPSVPGDDARAEAYRLAMYEAWDMLTGRLCPELGGKAEYLQVVGVNYYDRNQWINEGPAILKDDPQYRPFHEILQEVWGRYQLPIFVSETGIENEDRPHWFHYVCQEVRQAISLGVPIEGICLYPILNHPGWDDERHCHNGLYDYADEQGHREVYAPFAEAIRQEYETDDLFVRNQESLTCQS